MRRDRDAFVFFLDEVDSNRQLRGREPVEQSLYLWSKMMLPNYLLSVLGDRMEMANSVEGRLPFLDHRLVELVVKMPVEYKIRGMTEKYLLREAAKPFLTDTVYRRQKHPFLAPPAAGRKRDALLDMTQDILRSRETCAPFYDSAAIGAMLDGLNQADADTREQSDPGLMIALSMSLMHKRFGVSA
jgi:asparagine synthase (glutamine-hydrolysing)